jgi:hypothetical protein
LLAISSAFPRKIGLSLLHDPQHCLNLRALPQKHNEFL